MVELRLVATKLALTLYRIDLFHIVSLEVMGNNIGLTMGHMNRGSMRRGGYCIVVGFSGTCQK